MAIAQEKPPHKETILKPVQIQQENQLLNETKLKGKIQFEGTAKERLRHKEIILKIAEIQREKSLLKEPSHQETTRQEAITEDNKIVTYLYPKTRYLNTVFFYVFFKKKSPNLLKKSKFAVFFKNTT